MDKICPMKFNLMTADCAMRKLTLCDKENCAWYCDYDNGNGECAIASLSCLYEGLDSISHQLEN